MEQDLALGALVDGQRLALCLDDDRGRIAAIDVHLLLDVHVLKDDGGVCPNMVLYKPSRLHQLRAGWLGCRSLGRLRGAKKGCAAAATASLRGSCRLVLLVLRLHVLGHMAQAGSAAAALVDLLQLSKQVRRPAAASGGRRWCSRGRGRSSSGGRRCRRGGGGAIQLVGCSISAPRVPGQPHLRVLLGELKHGLQGSCEQVAEVHVVLVLAPVLHAHLVQVELGSVDLPLDHGHSHRLNSHPLQGTHALNDTSHMVDEWGRAVLQISSRLGHSLETGHLLTDHLHGRLLAAGGHEHPRAVESEGILHTVGHRVCLVADLCSYIQEFLELVAHKHIPLHNVRRHGLFHGCRGSAASTCCRRLDTQLGLNARQTRVQ
mmetsp:Transcript_132799/g.187553  ORF Transcript_132799/g.187553 Transcript_132799/m.187553 type:complete len:375 (+) Transcript_132799:324-1448(+)